MAPKDWTACISLCKGGIEVGLVGGIRELIYQGKYLTPTNILKYNNRVAEFDQYNKAYFRFNSNSNDTVREVPSWDKKGKKSVKVRNDAEFREA